MEVQMDKIKRHKELCEKMNKTYNQKNEKYGDSFSVSVQKYGYVAALTRISDKFHRFEQLILSKKDGSDTDESIIDTCLDAANYFLMTVIELESDEEKKCKCDCDYLKDIVITPVSEDKDYLDEMVRNSVPLRSDDTASVTPIWKYEPEHGTAISDIYKANKENQQIYYKGE